MHDQGYYRHHTTQQSSGRFEVTEPTIAGRAPIAIDVDAGKTYYWCSCGRSTTQPFCSGAHQGSEFEPTPYVAERSGRVYFCACKQSGKAPLCDGTHKTL
jgi:CDGSH iron-sulfur domain-containing protein 3